MRSKNMEPVAGNGLLHRRAFLRGGAAMAGAMTGYSLVPSASAQQLTDDRWSLAGNKAGVGGRWGGDGQMDSLIRPKTMR